jgi:methionyl-tRNA synthetase
VNIASRSAGFIVKKFDKTLSAYAIEGDLYNEFVAQGGTQVNFSKIVNLNHIVLLSFFFSCLHALFRAFNHLINLSIFNAQHEWFKFVMVKEEGKEAQVHDVTSLAINLFRVLVTYLKPVLPVMAEQVVAFLNIDSLRFNNLGNTQVNFSKIVNLNHIVLLSFFFISQVGSYLLVHLLIVTFLVNLSV